MAFCVSETDDTYLSTLLEDYMDPDDGVAQLSSRLAGRKPPVAPPRGRVSLPARPDGKTSVLLIRRPKYPNFAPHPEETHACASTER